MADTVLTYSSAYRVLQPKAFVNQYAAMPSLHVGWDLLIGMALFLYARHRVIRMIGLVLPVLMAISVVATANHYIVDVAAGIGLVLLCRLLAVRLEKSQTNKVVATAVRLEADVGDSVVAPRPKSLPQPSAPR